MIFNPSILRRVSIAIHKDPFFYEQSYSYIPFLNITGQPSLNSVFSRGNVLIPKGSVQVAVPNLDLFNKSMMLPLEKTAKDPDEYYLGVVANLSLSNIDFLKAVDTFTYSKFIPSYQNETIKTEGSIQCNVLLPFGDNFNSNFMVVLWRLSVFNFVPFFLNTDVLSKNLGGPLFVKDFSIRVDGSENVEIDMSFVGGTSILPPTPYSDRVTQSEAVSQISRTAKIYDCVIVCGFNGLSSSDVESQGVYEPSAPFRESFSIQGVNIKSMKLEIKSEIKTFYTGNDGVTKNLEDGMKYISSGGRAVSGQFSFVDTKDFSNYFNAAANQELILYFGGPFYYPMQNVSIQSFSLKINFDGVSYTHEINFVALLQPSVHKEYYKQSEFDINYQGLFAPIEPKIYARKPFRVVE